MGILHKFVAYAEKLSVEERDEVDAVLYNYMQGREAHWELSPEQAAENARRVADPNPEYATQAEVDAVFGKPLPS